MRRPNQVIQSETYREYVAELTDQKGRARITSAARQIQLGNFGDSKRVGNGVLERRIHSGPGYRIYFARVGEQVVLLIAAGEKSTQQSDIKRAAEILEAFKEAQKGNG